MLSRKAVILRAGGFKVRILADLYSAFSTGIRYEEERILTGSQGVSVINKTGSAILVYSIVIKAVHTFHVYTNMFLY